MLAALDRAHHRPLSTASVSGTPARAIWLSAGACQNLDIVDPARHREEARCAKAVSRWTRPTSRLQARGERPPGSHVVEISTVCALFSHRGPRRAMGETDPAATLNAHPTATGTSSSTIPTSPVCVAPVLSLVSSSDDVRTAAAQDIGDVLRRVLRLWKVDVAGAAAAARGAHGPGGCCGQRSSHGESATVDF